MAYQRTGLGANPRSVDRIRIEFYERFQKICADSGLVRQSSQTQREFAGVVQQSFEDWLQPTGLAAFPADLVERFYRIRFGTEPLDTADLEELGRQLDRLEQCLQSELVPVVSSRS